MERNGSQGSDNASTTINPKTRTNACCAPQPLQVNSAANKSWLINYVEAVLPRHIINALTSTQAAPGENAHTHKDPHRPAHIQTHTFSNMQTYTKMDTHAHKAKGNTHKAAQWEVCVRFPQMHSSHMATQIKSNVYVHTHTHTHAETHTHTHTHTICQKLGF